MNNSANSELLGQVAVTLLGIISQRDVSPEQVAQAAGFFAGSDNATDASVFSQLVGVVQQDLPNNQALIDLAVNYRNVLSDGHFASDEQAHKFIQRFTEAIGIGLLLSKPMTLGYARRMAGNPFDSYAIQTTGISGWMVLYTVEGVGVLDTGVRQVEMKPGNAVLFEPGSVFSFYRKPGCDCWGHYWVAFHATERWRAWLSWPRVGPNVGFLDSGSDNADIEDSFKLLLQNYITPSSMTMELNHNLLEQLILRCRNLAPTPGLAGIDPRIAKAQTYIAENFNKAFGIEAVANIANLSVSGLACVFRRT